MGESKPGFENPKSITLTDGALHYVKSALRLARKETKNGNLCAVISSYKSRVIFDNSGGNPKVSESGLQIGFNTPENLDDKYLHVMDSTKIYFYISKTSCCDDKIIEIDRGELIFI